MTYWYTPPSGIFSRSYLMGSHPWPAEPFNVQRIAIIGAGPSGLSTAKFLLAEKSFNQIDVFEQQPAVGGVWFYHQNIVGHIDIPQTTPQHSPELPVWPKGAAAPLFSNPMYDKLNTNIPKELMKFSDQDFPSESLLYPTREDVQEYLVEYSQDVKGLIKFSTRVEDICLLSQDGQHRWELTSKSTITNETTKSDYDAIMVANGHYSVPFIPQVPGIEVFNSKYPAVISHSKLYRTSEDFINKKVIVVGAGPSGLDIAMQIAQVCKSPLLRSVRAPSSLKEDNKEEVSVIAEFLIEQRGVRFADGRIETDIDAIVYCTGYLYSYPFLESLDPPIVTTGRLVHRLYRQLFNIDYPTLAFAVLQKKIIPFPLSEVQASAVAKVWSNKLHLPRKEEMELLEKKELEEQGDEHNFHILGYPKDADYINGLHDWVKTSVDGFAKQPAYWGRRERWLREIAGWELKKKFLEEGERAKSTGDLGFELENGSNVP